MGQMIIECHHTDATVLAWCEACDSSRKAQLIIPEGSVLGAADCLCGAIIQIIAKGKVDLEARIIPPNPSAPAQTTLQ